MVSVCSLFLGVSLVKAKYFVSLLQRGLRQLLPSSAPLNTTCTAIESKLELGRPLWQNLQAVSTSFYNRGKSLCIVPTHVLALVYRSLRSSHDFLFLTNSIFKAYRPDLEIWDVLSRSSKQEVSFTCLLSEINYASVVDLVLTLSSAPITFTLSIMDTLKVVGRTQ